MSGYLKYRGKLAIKNSKVPGLDEDRGFSPEVFTKEEGADELEIQVNDNGITTSSTSPSDLASPNSCPAVDEEDEEMG